MKTFWKTESEFYEPDYFFLESTWFHMTGEKKHQYIYSGNSKAGVILEEDT